MKRLASIVLLLVALALPGHARAATEVAITSPQAGDHSLSGVVPVTVNASATSGVYSVQLQVDGKNVGAPDLTPTALYTYVIPWDTSGLAPGNHTLVAVASDWSLPLGGPTTDSAAVVVDVGPPYPTAQIDAPSSGSVVRGTVQLAATVTAAVQPVQVQFDVDGTPLPTSASAPWTATWPTSGDGPHAVHLLVTDGRGKTASATTNVTVDNTRPTTQITVPATQWTYATSPLAVQATASDASGIASVQFLVDGVAVGAPLTGTQATYSALLPVSGAVGSQHRVQSVATDLAGNTATSGSVYFTLSAAPPSIKVAAPADWTFGRGVVAVTGAPTGGTPPYALRLVVDGKATTLTTGAAPYTIQWDTRGLTAGTHTVALSLTDSQGKGSTSAAVHVTVDNTPPTVALVAPAKNASIGASFAASATASDAYGISSVQFLVDGQASGPALTAPDAGTQYTYSATLSGAGLADGTHSVTVAATDQAGNVATTAPTYVTVGATAPSVTVTAPPDWTLVRGIVPVTATVTGGTPPLTAKLVLDGKATTVTTTSAPYTLSWDTRAVADGTHLLQVSVSDAAGRGSTSSAVHETVDNTPPVVVVNSPAAGQRVTAPTLQAQVNASDAYGMRSVQFTLDGANVGPLLTAPDSGTLYVYSTTIDLSSVAAGTHTIGSVATDAAGNTTTTSTQFVSGPGQYLPVLNYHEIAPTGGYTIYDETPAEADAQLAYLKANGYQSVTLQQYQQWLAGADIGIAKPVLITVDDGLKTELAWDTLLQKYGFNAVMFVITGFADQKTPGDSDPNNMTWADIQALAASGRWQIGFHAGLYGHGDSYGDGVPIGTQYYSASCPYFYSCLSHSRRGVNETPAAFQAAVSAEIANGQAELAQKVPGAITTAMAAPFNDAGQWTNLYNDPSGTIQSWLPGFLASKFSLVFTQTSPVQYGQASGLVGSLTGFNRHYRFEVHTNTTIEQFAAALTDPAFVR